MSETKAKRKPKAKPKPVVAIQPEALRLQDIAPYLAVSLSTVERWRSSGKLPKPDISEGGILRWGKKTIDAWFYSGGRA